MMARKGSLFLSKPVLLAAGVVLAGGLLAGAIWGMGSLGEKSAAS